MVPGTCLEHSDVNNAATQMYGKLIQFCVKKTM